MKMNIKGFVGLLGLLLTVLIISFMAYLMFKVYFGKSTGMTKETQEMANQAGIDTTSQQGILNSAKSLINNAEVTERNQGQ